MQPVLIRRLVEAEDLYGEAGVAERLGVKVRMWQYVKLGKYGLSLRMLRHARRSFPGLRDAIDAYLLEEPDPEPAVAGVGA